jgi:hypothetical protein
MANGDVLNLVRKWYDWWLFDSVGFMTFRDAETGKIVRVNRHFTIKVVQEI